MIINKWLLLVEERKMIVTMLFLSLTALAFLAIIHIQEKNYWNYFIIFSLLLIMTNVMETFVSCLYSKIISSRISGYSGIIIIFCTTGGKIIGCLLVAAYLYYRYLLHKLPWFCMITFYFVVTFITLKNYKNLKVRAISRLLKKRDFN